MSNDSTVRPELIVKIFMGLGVISLMTIAVCMILLVSRGSQVVTRRPLAPMENRIQMMRNDMSPITPGMTAPGAVPGQGFSEGVRPPLVISPEKGTEKSGKK